MAVIEGREEGIDWRRADVVLDACAIGTVIA